MKTKILQSSKEMNVSWSKCGEVHAYGLVGEFETCILTENGIK